MHAMCHMRRRIHACHVSYVSGLCMRSGTGTHSEKDSQYCLYLVKEVGH